MYVILSAPNYLQPPWLVLLVAVTQLKQNNYNLHNSSQDNDYVCDVFAITTHKSCKAPKELVCQHEVVLSKNQLLHPQLAASSHSHRETEPWQTPHCHRAL